MRMSWKSECHGNGGFKLFCLGSVRYFCSSIAPWFILRFGWLGICGLSICLVAENINQAWEVVYPRIQTWGQIIWKMQILWSALMLIFHPSVGKKNKDFPKKNHKKYILTPNLKKEKKKERKRKKVYISCLKFIYRH